ncbi:MAG: TetR/AcrR family transcriptional regulator [Firmicutes bacterium]|nr:TetR/AcrR family transcriptional regulator [Bacillota bacterium]
MIIRKKIEENKTQKESNLLESAFKLFTDKGIKDTSIQEIADNAGVGKGTFYLYFKDKYDIQEQLITRKSNKLFNDALKKLSKENIDKFDEQIIFIINYVIDELTKNTILLKFISKNLSFGVYNSKLNHLVDEKLGIKEMFLNGVKENNLKLKNPDVTLFMIIELTSSTCFSCILNKEPLPINEYKPYLFEEIKRLLKEN